MGRTGMRLMLTGAAAMSLLAAGACTGAGGASPPKLGKFTVVAGNGEKGSPEAGETAWTQPLRDVKDLAVGPKGEVYVAADCTVYEIVDNEIEPLYEEGRRWTGPGVRDNGPGCPDTIATDEKGDVFIGQWNPPLRIWELTANGKRVIVAGAERLPDVVGLIQPPEDTEGKPATKILPGSPRSIVPAPDGSYVYVLYPFNVQALVRKVDVGGAIHTVAGVPTSRGQVRITKPIPAEDVVFSGDAKLARSSDGALYVADMGQLLRIDDGMVAPAGVVTGDRLGSTSNGGATVPYGIEDVAVVPGGRIVTTDFREVHLVGDGPPRKLADLPKECTSSAPISTLRLGPGVAVRGDALYLIAPECDRVLRLSLPKQGTSGTPHP